MIIIKIYFLQIKTALQSAPVSYTHLDVYKRQLIVLADNTNIALLVVAHRCRKLAKGIKVITHVCLIIISK